MLTAVTMALALAAGDAAAASCQPPEFVPRFECPANQANRVVFRPGGPNGKGAGSATEFCTAYPRLCRAQRPHGCRPEDGCSWDCEIRDACGRLASLCSWKLVEAPEGTVAGGLLGVLKPASGERVGRQIEVVGFAHAFFAMPAVSFSLDGKLVTARDFSAGFCVPATCQSPWGIWHSSCQQNSGFRAVLDLGSSAQSGQHQLQVFVYDHRGLPGVLEIPIVIDPKLP